MAAEVAKPMEWLAGGVLLPLRILAIGHREHIPPFEIVLISECVGKCNTTSQKLAIVDRVPHDLFSGICNLPIA
jgi:hypothetical protein